MSKKLQNCILILLLAFCFSGSAESAGPPLANRDTPLFTCPGYGERQIATVYTGTECEVLGEYGAWSLVATGNLTGYIRTKYLNGLNDSPRVESESTGIPEIVLSGFDVPGYMDRGTKEAVRVESGVVSSSLPFRRVRIFIYNIRAMQEELGVYADFSGDGAQSFDAGELLGRLNLNLLSSGEKRMVVEVSGDFGTVRAGAYEFYVRGACYEPVSMTEDCTIRTSSGGKIPGAHDNSFNTGWRRGNSDDYVVVTLPEDKTAHSITLKWNKPVRDLTLIFLDAGGNELLSETIPNEEEIWNLYREILPGARQIEIRTVQKDDILCEIDVYEEGREPETVQKWEKLPEDVDLLMVTAHKNDETLYFSGTIPLYLSEGKVFALVVMTEHANRAGQEELFECLWLMGYRYEPIILYKLDYKPIGFWRLAEEWGGYDEACGQLVEILRRYKPEVVMTHGFRGEFRHMNHKMTNCLTLCAVERAADPALYPASAAQYGAWNTPKLYVHQYNQNGRVHLPFDTPLDAYGGRTAMEVAYCAFDKYQTQLSHPTYSLDADGVRYDKTFFGLYRTTVGSDVARDDLFEHID